MESFITLSPLFPTTEESANTARVLANIIGRNFSPQVLERIHELNLQ